ncbi:MAG: PQQ-binding-like beta-propeller repeat protein [Bacteroidales bacterium]|nr:PQQ-binding-like beta-propeller repeat protein [Bacteroidales bacterium]
MYRRVILLAVLSVCSFIAGAQQAVKFAFITDNHYSEGAASNADLQAIIEDINSQKGIDFVVMGGDLTDFGSDEEIAAVKATLDKLSPEYYVVAGNHDAKWSESGCNTFKEVFGYEHFNFTKKGWRFLGLNCGPDMRMAPALIPKEGKVWLQSLDEYENTIMFNHYPQDSSVLNYFDNVREFKRIGVKMMIGGHLHVNKAFDYDGLPGAVCRSALSSGNHPGYNIVKIEGQHISIAERRVFAANSHVEFEPWYQNDLVKVEDTVEYDKYGLPLSYPWMRYDVNEQYPFVKEIWKIQDNSNVVAGFAKNDKVAFYSTASGCIRAVSLKDGSQIWTRTFPGKIFSTPAVDGKVLVFGCTDGNIYAVKATDGSPLWSVKANKSVLSSPTIFEGKVYIGSSDGIFRCIDLKSGNLLWSYDDVEGFVESKPYVDAEQVVFGTWGNRLYSLSTQTGKLQWVWRSKQSSRMYSPAACYPVKSDGKIFVAVPDRKVYAVDAKTGETVYNVDGGREAIGISEDGKYIYSKTMFNSAYKFKASSTAIENGTLPVSSQEWNVKDGTGYEISPTALVEKDGMVLIPTDKGNIIALSDKDGSMLWAHKLSVALINPMQVWSKGGKTYILASTMDGVLSLLEVQH